MQLARRVEQNRISEKEYRKIKVLHYSALKKFDTSRHDFFLEYVMGEAPREKKSKSLILGSLVHSNLCGFTDGNIDHTKFVLAQNKPPAGQVGELVEELVDRSMRSMSDGVQQDNFKIIFEDAFQRTKYDFDGNEVKFKGKTVEKALELFQATGEAYYKECMENIGKDVVSMAQLESAEKLSKKLREHAWTAEYANMNACSSIDVFNELPILFELDLVPYKAMLDKIIVYHDRKEIQPIDWKTTWSDNVDYAYLKYGYYLQCCLYNMALNIWKIEHDLQEYKVLPMKNVFIDTEGFNAPIILTLSEDDIDRAYRGFSNRGIHYNGLKYIQEEIAECVATGDWTSTKKLRKSNGVKRLNIRYGSRE